MEHIDKLLELIFWLIIVQFIALVVGVGLILSGIKIIGECLSELDKKNN